MGYLADVVFRKWYILKVKKEERKKITPEPKETRKEKKKRKKAVPATFYPESYTPHI